MALTGNKGEWSEIYTLFKLLGEGKVYAGDANLKKLELYYPILNIIREESKKYEYKPNVERNIVVIDEDGNEYTRLSMEKFLEKSSQLLFNIKSCKNGTFALPEIEDFMGKIGCTKLKAPSQDKADIHIVIHDSHTNRAQLLGFSIKSQLGSASTLLNAGTTTNFTYRVMDKILSDEEIKKINSIDKHRERMASIIESGCTLSFCHVDNEVFMNNLLFLDAYMPQFVADCLLANCMVDSSSVYSSVSLVAQMNPFGYKGKNVEAFYEHKMKVLLVSVALGMTPGKEWMGRYDANGGYLVVREDGEIVCYHFYYQNEVEDYLYNNTRFESASRSRYKYGALYRADDGEVYIKLNLQIRFKK